MKVRSWRGMLALGAVSLAAGGLCLVLGQPQARSGPVQPPASERFVVAPGVLEGARPSVELRFSVAGKVSEVLVEEGATVKRGQVLAVLDGRLEQAQVAAAQATADAARARLLLVTRGPLSQELKIAQAQLTESERRLADRALDLDIKRQLVESHSVAEVEGREARLASDIAEAQVGANASKLELLRLGPRAELRAEAAAQLRLADAELDYRKGLLDETQLRAPMDGVVLRRWIEPGAHALPDAPAPAFVVADRSKLILRAEVDEADWSLLRIGQDGYATPPTGPQVKGKLLRLAAEFGAKRVGLEDPHVPRDTRVLEALFELEPGHDLPSGLRMDLHLPIK